VVVDRGDGLPMIPPPGCARQWVGVIQPSPVLHPVHTHIHTHTWPHPPICMPHRILEPYKHYVPFWKKVPEEILEAMAWAKVSLRRPTPSRLTPLCNA
jgi:hypothetical protein